MLLAFALVVVGLLVLSYGADRFIQSSINIAHHYKVSPLIIGMTIVAFGTSAPEAAVSWISSYFGQSGIALGNVVGSNLFNVLVVLGITSLVLPLSVNLKIIKFEVPFMIFVSLLTYFFLYDLSLSLIEGLVLFSFFIVFNWLQFSLAKKEKKALDFGVEDVPSDVNLLNETFLFFLGAILLVGGSRVFVIGAEDLAKVLGISDVIIGLTIVALGTSLPELAASLAAAKKNQSDMAIGNVVGSNIYNITLVLGGNTFFATTMSIDSLFLQQDLLLFVFVAIILLPILHTGLKMQRWEGIAFLVLYIFYILSLVAREVSNISFPFWNYTLLLIYSISFFVLISLILNIKKVSSKKNS